MQHEAEYETSRDGPQKQLQGLLFGSIYMLRRAEVYSADAALQQC